MDLHIIGVLYYVVTAHMARTEAHARKDVHADAPTRGQGQGRVVQGRRHHNRPARSAARHRCAVHVKGHSPSALHSLRRVQCRHASKSVCAHCLELEGAQRVHMSVNGIERLPTVYQPSAEEPGNLVPWKLPVDRPC